MNQTIHFFAQDEGSVKALLPVYALCASWSGVVTRFYAARCGRELLGRQGMACAEFHEQGYNPSGDDIPNLIVTGASMWNSIEKQAIAYAHVKGIRSMTIVDHGSNYWGRFTVSGEHDLSALPDCILAPDKESRDNMVKADFPPERIIVTGNPYFDTFNQAAEGCAASNKCAILCIMQPERSGGEYRSDTSWFPIIKGLGKEFAARAMLIIRPHPKENPEMYRPFKQMGIQVDELSDITDLIIKSDIVIGKNSTSLIEAVFRGKAVISLECGNRQFERLSTESMGLSAFAHSENELRELIRKYILQPHSIQKLKKIRYYNDGRNTERAAACLLSMLDRATPNGDEATLPGRMANV